MHLPFTLKLGLLSSAKFFRILCISFCLSVHPLYLRALVLKAHYLLLHLWTKIKWSIDKNLPLRLSLLLAASTLSLSSIPLEFLGQVTYNYSSQIITSCLLFSQLTPGLYFYLYSLYSGLYFYSESLAKSRDFSNC